ncbi:hypothetical protein JTE90_016052 [Oedothorax gibbosus]|uniref:Cytochrome b5 n=1 Tax=Oedothorax gibbosus TaxID=931172 RepID=A0AAV6U4Q7_9ARAC|nr:hypothetical protein JTE90_016052 [Oedothorax gibbosus]
MNFSLLAAFVFWILSYFQSSSTFAPNLLFQLLKEFTFIMSDEKPKTYTLKEISEHSSNDSVWVLINNGVYDVSKFLEEHPGGPEVLMDWAGKEATEAFEDVGHSSDARELMKNYKIGELCEEDQKSKAKVNGTSSWCVLQ